MNYNMSESNITSSAYNIQSIRETQHLLQNKVDL